MFKMCGKIPLKDVDEYSQANQSNMSWQVQKKSSPDFELDCKDLVTGLLCV